MNILPKKKWHVRTKENMARVRRDEANAAAEEKARADRTAIADNEDRVRRMKMRRQDPFASSSVAGPSTQGSALYEMGLIGSAAEADYSEASAGQKHVNLFAELELQERKNLAVGNKDYAAEKKKERDEWESKMGIMKRFAEDTKEFAKEQYWWEKIPLVREEAQSGSRAAASAPVPVAPQPSATCASGTVAKKRRREESEKRPHRHHHRRDDGEKDAAKKERAERTEVKLERLRAERLQRERLERQRAANLLASASAAGIKKEEEGERGESRRDHESELRRRLEQERGSGYNSQFNPDFARPRRGGDSSRR